MAKRSGTSANTTAAAALIPASAPTASIVVIPAKAIQLADLSGRLANLF